MSSWLKHQSLVGGGGGFGGDRGGGGGDMVTQEDTIFIQGMDPGTSEDELCTHFGAIGMIKVNNVMFGMKINLMKSMAYWPIF